MGVPPVWQTPPATGGGDDVTSALALGIVVVAMAATYLAVRAAARRGQTPDTDQVPAQPPEPREPAAVR